MQHKINVRAKRRTNSGWNRWPSRSSRPTKNRFSGSDIDINRFINKAQPAKAAEVFTPRYTFAQLQIHQALKRSITERGYKTPTPIQDKAIPDILSGHDVIGLANTGTGKTAAFLIPIINKILISPTEKALVVVPTRELAIQIQEEFVALAKRLNLYAVVLVGGANMGPQIRQLKMKHNVVIGTPGRLKDLIGRKILDLSKFNNVILDEADRMLDMGFIGDVKFLLSLVSSQRQTLLFSATFSPEVENLVRQFLTNPQKISIKTGETSRQVDQDIIRVTATQDKIEVLHELLAQTEFEKVLVFTRTKHGADGLSKKLYQRGFKSEAIHGDKPHNKRQRALKMFKENVIDILIATDVASRGLDIPNVSHVINYDIPATYEDYVHRIGRTGRAGKTGKALTFVP